jgi:hypothetical protein
VSQNFANNTITTRTRVFRETNKPTMLRTICSNVLRESRRRICRHCPTTTTQMPVWNSNGALTVVDSSTHTRHIASRMFTDGLKGRFNDLVSRGTKKATESFKKTTDTARDALEVQAKKVSEQLSTGTQKAYEKGSSKASEVFQRSSVAASEVLTKGKSSTEDALRSSARKVSEQLQSTTDAVVKTSKQAASQTGQSISNKSSKLANATSERIRNSSIGVLANAQELTKKAARWFFVWSLAAIAVYGLATSIPSALIRYSFNGGSKQEQTVEQPPVDSTAQVDQQSSQGKGWMRWVLSGGRSEDKTTASQNIPTSNSSSKGVWSLLRGDDSNSNGGKD